jgi:hypothetical protein
MRSLVCKNKVNEIAQKGPKSSIGCAAFQVLFPSSLTHETILARGEDATGMGATGGAGIPISRKGPSRQFVSASCGDF